MLNGSRANKHLEEIILLISVEGDLGCMAEMVKMLRMDKFRNPKRFSLQIDPNREVEDWDGMAVQ